MEKKQRRTYSSAKEVASKQSSGVSFTSIKLPKDASLLTLKEGIMLLDVIPYEVGKGNPNADEGTYHYERSFFTHRGVGVGSDTYVCLSKTANTKCPICEYRAKLARDPDMDPDVVKGMAPKHRQIFNVINCKDREKGVQILECSYHVFGNLLNERIVNDEEDEGWANFFHPTKGFTLKLTVKESSGGGYKFMEVTAIDLRTRKEQYEDTIVDDAFCLDDIPIVESYEKLKSVLLETEGKSKDEEDDDEDEEEEKSAKKSKKVDDEDEEEEDEPEDDDEEEETPSRHEPPKSKVKAGVKKAPNKEEDDEEDSSDEDDEEDDDDDENEEEEEEEEKKPAKKKVETSASAKGKKKPAKEEEDEDDDWEDE